MYSTYIYSSLAGGGACPQLGLTRGKHFCCRNLEMHFIYIHTHIYMYIHMYIHIARWRVAAPHFHRSWGKPFISIIRRYTLCIFIYTFSIIYAFIHRYIYVYIHTIYVSVYVSVDPSRHISIYIYLSIYLRFCVSAARGANLFAREDRTGASFIFRFFSIYLSSIN